MKMNWNKSVTFFVAVAFLLGISMPAHAAAPIVKTVPWIAAKPLIPHDTFPGKSIRLKGTSDRQGSNIQYTWDFGDGTPVATGIVTNMYAIEAQHTYAGSTGTVFTARLTVQDLGTGESASKEYYVAMRDKTLGTEVNVAIDEGLWAMHRDMTRFDSEGIQYGDWRTWSGYHGPTVANINAFEVNGHLEIGSPDNPYTETVARGMHAIFTYLTSWTPGTTYDQPLAIAAGTSWDGNGNGVNVYDNQNWPYQTGMFIDAIVASGTPLATAPTGPANVVGKTYKDIVQDMVDVYQICMYPDPNYGGWRYSCQEFPDNSVCQWGAIGILGANSGFGASIPVWLQSANLNWLTYSQDSTNGWFGYTGPGYGWGPYADTASGMVQLVMDETGRGDTRWDKAETFMRENWDDEGGYGYPIKGYFYGLFSFAKSMLLHKPAIVMLHSSKSGGKPDLDWYAAEKSKGAPSDGVARNLIDRQNPAGWWWYNDASGDQYPFETAWAIMMLNRTLFEAGAPVAVAKAVPNPAIAGETISLDGSGSYHQDAAKGIVKWEWDLNNDGVYEHTGVTVTGSWLAIGDYVVRLKVTDNGTPAKIAETFVTVRITQPPVAPTANAGGPYVFCSNRTPWFLDGTGSINPDEGQHQLNCPSCPGDTINSSPAQFAWDLDGDGQFDDTFGKQPNVTSFFQTMGNGNYLIQLKVTDTNGVSFPASGYGDLSSTASSTISVKSSTDIDCANCIGNLRALAKPGKVTLTWGKVSGADHYNVYRSVVSGGPYIKLAATASYLCLDSAVANGTKYYYVVRPAALNDEEGCQSNESWAQPMAYTR